MMTARKRGVGGVVVVGIGIGVIVMIDDSTESEMIVQRRSVGVDDCVIIITTIRYLFGLPGCFHPPPVRTVPARALKEKRRENG